MLVQQTDYVALSVWARSNFYPQKAIKNRVVASEKMQCRCTKSREHLILNTFWTLVKTHWVYTVAELLSSDDNSQQGVPFLFFNQGLWAPATFLRPPSIKRRRLLLIFPSYSWRLCNYLGTSNGMTPLVSMVSIGKWDKMGWDNCNILQLWIRKWKSPFAVGNVETRKIEME